VLPLNHHSMCAVTDIGRQYRTSDRRDQCRPQHDVAVIVISRLVVRAQQGGLGLIEIDLTVEKMKPHAVAAVDASLLRIEVIKGAPVVLVDISGLDQHALDARRDGVAERARHAVGIKDRIDNRGDLVVIVRNADGNPAVATHATFPLPLLRRPCPAILSTQRRWNSHTSNIVSNDELLLLMWQIDSQPHGPLASVAITEPQHTKDALAPDDAVRDGKVLTCWQCLKTPAHEQMAAFR